MSVPVPGHGVACPRCDNGLHLLAGILPKEASSLKLCTLPCKAPSSHPPGSKCPQLPLKYAHCPSSLIKRGAHASAPTLKRVLQNSDMSVMGVPAGERSALKGASSSFFSSHPLKAYCSCTCGRSL
eukprot:1158714-Pelagomonas_calceolata.AAC.11